MTPDPADLVDPGGGRQLDPGTAWAGVEEDPDGGWWVTVTDDTATTAAGPYLDEVQALRVLHTWGHT